MANKFIPKIDIYSGVVLNAMKREGVSFRKLGQLLGYKDGGDRMLREYVYTGKCPAYVLSQICDALHICPSDVMVGKTVWMRIGVTVQLDKQDYDWIVSKGRAGYDIDIPDCLAREYLKRAVPDGDSYIPVEQPFFRKEDI